MTQTADIPTTTDLDDELAALLIHEHRTQMRPAFERLWSYYRNELDFAAGDRHRPYRAAQEAGLPRRLTHAPRDAVRREAAGGGRREVVVENDIAWRIHALVDFMFARPVGITSLADDPDLAAAIERVLRAAFDANGGIAFFQDLALLGAVYGFADVLLRANQLPPAQAADPPPPAAADRGESSPPDADTGIASPDRVPSRPMPLGADAPVRYARKLILETVEAPRAIPVLDPSDYRRLDAYLLHYTQTLNEVDRGSFLARLVDRGGRAKGRRAASEITETWTDAGMRMYRDGEPVAEAVNPLGRLPVVHIQNLPQPFFYEGLSEVEPLIPLQDELNTRLSDRANRVTFQSFKMYLGKGIDGFLDRPVGPGQMWTTDNPDASIEAFGGDGPNPSEDAHITEIREAMDKTSAVSPLAAGLLRDRVGNLTSENALRIVMMGLLSRTEKKRLSYGRGIEQLAELILHALDVAGVLRTDPDDRRIRLDWPGMLPEDESQRLRDAKTKIEIGVPQQRVLAELGYADSP